MPTRAVSRADGIPAACVVLLVTSLPAQPQTETMSVMVIIAQTMGLMRVTNRKRAPKCGIRLVVVNGVLQPSTGFFRRMVTEQRALATAAKRKGFDGSAFVRVPQSALIYCHARAIERAIRSFLIQARYYATVGRGRCR